MVYKYEVPLKLSLLGLIGVTGYFRYETYQCTQDSVDHTPPTIVKDPIIVFPNCKWQQYVPPLSRSIWSTLRSG